MFHSSHTRMQLSISPVREAMLEILNGSYSIVIGVPISPSIECYYCKGGQQLCLLFSTFVQHQDTVGRRRMLESLTLRVLSVRVPYSFPEHDLWWTTVLFKKIQLVKSFVSCEPEVRDESRELMRKREGYIPNGCLTRSPERRPTVSSSRRLALANLISHEELNCRLILRGQLGQLPMGKASSANLRERVEVIKRAVAFFRREALYCRSDWWQGKTTAENRNGRKFDYFLFFIYDNDKLINARII